MQSQDPWVKRALAHGPWVSHPLVLSQLVYLRLSTMMATPNKVFDPWLIHPWAVSMFRPKDKW